MRDLIYDVTCGFWTERKVENELLLDSSNSRGLHKQHSVANRVFYIGYFRMIERLSFYLNPCYFREKVINCEILHTKHVSNSATQLDIIAERYVLLYISRGSFIGLLWFSNNFA